MPPEPLPEGEPGDVIRAEPMDAYLVPGVRLRARAWRMLYRSTSRDRRADRGVRDACWCPHGRTRGPRPLIGYAIGTHGIGDAAAPSRLLRARSRVGGGADRDGARPRLGGRDHRLPGPRHARRPHLHGRPRARPERARRDAGRPELYPDELPVEGPAAIIGYSEGGAAAAWAAQLQPSYAPDVPLPAVAAGAAAADVEAAGPSLDGSFFSFFIAYGGIGYAAAYPELTSTRT